MRAATFLGELIDAGHLHGGTARDQQGVIRAAAPRGMTVQGRLFLEHLKREEREASLWARAKKWGIPVITYAAGVLTPILSDFLRAVLPHAH